MAKKPMTETQAMNFVIAFGKNKGKTLEEIPSNYLEWLEEQNWIDEHPDLVEAIGLVLRWRVKNNSI
jgi:uncharacterized protein (DUF3820 family)